MQDLNAKTVEDHIGLAAEPLRLGIMCTLGPLRMAPFLSALRREYPGLRLRVRDAALTQLAALLDEGHLDLAILAQPGPLAGQWRAHPLYRERFAVAMPMGHPLAQHMAVRLADLDGLTYVSRANCEYEGFIDALMRRHRVALDVVFESEREEWVQMMIVAGVGIACMPEFSPLLPGLVTRPIIEPTIAREVSLVAPSGRRDLPAAETFTRAITRYDWTL